MHARGEDGALAAIPFELEQNPEFHMGGGGLYGTAGDYIKFTQMILNKGKGNGNQVLKPETVATMGQNHIGELSMGKMTTAAPIYTNDVDLYPDMVKKWGLSFLINTAKTAGRPQRRQPRLGGSRQHLFLDRSGARRHRRDPDAAVAVRGRQSAWKPSPASSAASMPGSMPAAARRRPRRQDAVAASRDSPAEGYALVAEPSASGTSATTIERDDAT